MMDKHFHADLIKQWADGHPIQTWLDGDKVWKDVKSPTWDYRIKYRLKPSKPLTKLVTAVISEDGEYVTTYMNVGPPNLALSFDGITNKLLKAEVL